MFSIFGFIYLLTNDQVQRSKVIQEEHLRYLQHQPSRVIANLDPQEIQRDLENDWHIFFEDPMYDKVNKNITHRGSTTTPDGLKISCTITTTFEEQAKFLSFVFRIRSTQESDSSTLNKTTTEFIRYFSKFFTKASNSQLLINWSEKNIQNPSASKIVIDQTVFFKNGTIGSNGTPNLHRIFSIEKETSP